jgi:hypothetical protein
MRWWALAAAVLALAALAPSASAAFPGANGQLVLTPTSGGGVLIASPHSGRAKRVCNAPHTCDGRATDAQFSPNGREVVIASGGRLQIATTSGACVFCLSSAPAWAPTGTDPAFSRDGLTMTYVHRGLWQVAPGNSKPTRLRVLDGPVSAVAWSGSAKVAAVRRGWLWTGVRRNNTVVLWKRVTRGSAPDWSPSGQELTFTHRGFVFTLQPAGHRLTRIGRGEAPAFSPDGRSLAYLNPHHQVTIHPLGHGRTRTLTGLRGRSLDWQPVSAVTRRGCAAANGAIVASGGEATIRAAANPEGGHIGWNGCLTTVGIPFHLNGGLDGSGYNLSLGRVALAGDYAALQFVYTDKYMDYTDTINVYDLRSGALVHSTPVACQGFPCTITSLAVNQDGFAAWDATDTAELPESNMTAISCPTTALCVAGDQSGHILVSTAPTGGRSAWTRLSLAAGTTRIEGVSCPTAALCVAVASDGKAYWSSDPTGGVAAWHAASLSAFTISGISCGSANLCVAVGGGAAYITTDPMSPASVWTGHPLSSGTTLLQGVSCVSSNLCLIGDSAGDVLASTDPTDASPSWTARHVAAGGVTSISCPTTGFCAAVASGSGGTAVLTTTDPAGTTPTWAAHSFLGFLGSVTCAGTSLCLAVGGSTTLTTTDPADASPAWIETTLAHQINVASCPTSNLCIAAGGPDILTFTGPTGGAAAWHSALVDARDCDPCLAETLTGVDDHGVHTLDTAPPGPGTQIADLRFTGSTLTWTHGGAPRSAGLS